MALRTANIVGSGPNGLAAAITLAQRGVAVTVYERNQQIGGACTTAELTLPGFHHDIGSSAYPLGVASPFFKTLPLARFGLRWIEPEVPVAHPLDDGSAVLLEPCKDASRLCEAMREQLGVKAARAWQRLLGPSVRNWPGLVDDFTKPLLRVPSHPLAMAQFGLPAMLPATLLAKLAFGSGRDGERARALFAGCAAHSVIPLSQVASAATGLVLAAAGHATGWPIAAGGAKAITDALSGYLRSLGGMILNGTEITTLAQMPPADVTLFDTSVAGMERIAGAQLSHSYRKALRHFKAGPGIFKVDYALSEPIPWTAKACARAATVHVGGTMEAIATSEHDSFYGRHSDRPYVLVVQPSLFDASRAPAGKHTAWAYCHVPAGSTLDRTDVIEQQMERFAPGFRETVLARRAWGAGDLGAWNPNLAGGDVSGGAMTLRQMVLRPTAWTYRTSSRGVYLCSSSTPPGGGVHGMCGHWAAMAALEDAQ